jgi:asparagine synthetase B (glutamine-hydrolysing)
MTEIYGFAGLYDYCIDLKNIFKSEKKLEIFQGKDIKKKSNYCAGLGHYSSGFLSRDKQPYKNKYLHGVLCGHILEDYAIDNIFEILSGKRFSKLENLNGIFSCGVWDQKNEALYLITDRYGFRPLYYYHDPEKNYFVFSANINDLAKSRFVKKRINWASWAVFLNLGYNLGNETGFKDIFLVPPGSVLKFQNNTIQIYKYKNILEIKIDENMSYSHALEGSIELFSQSVKRRNNGFESEKTVLLSGGLDSRRIAAELKKQNTDFETYTTRGFSPYDQESERAAAVAETLGLKNYFINLPEKDFFKNYWKRANYITGYETNLHQWILPLTDALPEEIKINYDGIAGDLISKVYISASGFNNTEEVYTASDQTALKVLNNKINNYSFMDKSISGKFSREQVLSSLKTELAGYENSPNMITFFYLLNRTRRSIALSPFRILLSRGIESFCPFLDNDFFDFTMSIPQKLKLKNNLRKDMTKKAWPLVSEVSFTNYGKKQRNKKYTNDIKYYSQRRKHLKDNIFEHYLKNNRIFSNKNAFPRIVKEIIISRKDSEWPTTVFAGSCLVFYEWLERYFDVN